MTQALSKLCKHTARRRNHCTMHAAIWAVLSVRNWALRGVCFLQGGKGIAINLLFKGEFSPDERC